MLCVCGKNVSKVNSVRTANVPFYGLCVISCTHSASGRERTERRSASTRIAVLSLSPSAECHNGNYVHYCSKWPDNMNVCGGERVIRPRFFYVLFSSARILLTSLSQAPHNYVYSMHSY